MNQSESSQSLVMVTAVASAVQYLLDIELISSVIYLGFGKQSEQLTDKSVTVRLVVVKLLPDHSVIL